MTRLRLVLILTASTVSMGLVSTRAQAACPTILVSPVSLPDGVANTPYSQSLAQAGAGSPTFSITSGALPTGLVLDAAGNITGTPSAAGTFVFTGTASDPAGCTGGRTYRVAITCPAITVDPSSVPDGFVGLPYPAQTLVGSGGAAPYVFTVTTGTLPAGLAQSGTGGQTISGTPTGPTGAFSFTVTGTDANSCTGTRSFSGSIGTCGTITVTPPASGQGTIGTSFSQQFTQTGASSPTFTIDPTSPDTLPSGWTLAPATGILSNPSPTGSTFTIKVRATDSGGCFGVSGNYVVTISPIANGETYSPVVVGNMSIDTATGTSFSVLTNDTPGSTANLLGGGLSAQGGDVTLNSATGTFTYNPKRGYEGPDSFQYTVTNGGQTSSPATASLTVGGMAWFVDNNAAACAAASCGRRSSPYNTLAAFQTANTTGAALDPKAGDRVFVFQSATSYSGPAAASIALRNTQRLIGQDDGAVVTFAAATGYTIPDTTQAVPVMDPNPPATTILSVAGQDVVTLAQDNVIRALTIDAANNAAIAAGAVNVGTLGSIDNVTMMGAGGGIQLGAHTGSLNVTSSSITGNGAGTAVSVVGASAGSAVFTSTVVNKTGGTLLSIQNRTGSGSVTFTGGSLTLTGGGDGIVLASNSATTAITLGPGIALTTATGRGLATNTPGALTIGGTSSTISATGGAALDLTATNLAGGGVTFATVSATTGAAQGINLNNLSGTLTIGATAITMNAGGTQGINVSGSSANVTFASGPGTTQISGAGGTQRILVGTSTGTINFGNTTVNGGTDAISLQNNSGGSRTFGTLVVGNTAQPTGAGFLHGAGGGATTVGAATITAATGIDIQSNASAITFSGTTTVNTSGGVGVSIQGNTAAANETFATLNVTKTGAGSAATIGNTTANNGSSTVNLGALSVSAANGTAILAGTTPLTTSGAGVVSATNGPAINATGTAFNATFGSVSSATSGTQGINLATCTGTLSMNGGTVTGAAGVPFAVSGGTLSATYSGAITHVAGNANAVVSVTGGHNTGTITFQSGANTATSGTGLVFAGANGVYVVNATSGTTSLNGTANGVTIGTSTGIFHFGSGVSVQNTTGTAVQINGTQPVALFSGPITQTTAQKAVVVTGVTGGSTGGIASPFSIRFAGNITKSTNAATAIDVNNNSGGSVGFDGGTISLSTAGSTALSMAANTGAAVTINSAGTTITTSGTAVSATGGGTLTLNGGSINASAGSALILNGVALGSGTLTSVTSGGGVNGISLTNVTGGTLTASGGSLTGHSGAPFLVSGGTVAVTYAGGVTQVNNAPLVSVAGGHATGAITFQTGTLSASNGTGLQFDNADGTYNFNATTTLNGGDAGVDITNGSGGSFTFGSGTAITNPSGVAYREDTSTATVAYDGTITKTNNASSAVDINAKTGGATTFSGAVSAATTTANAIDLTNAGGAVTFRGGLSVSTTSGVAFNATGAGASVNVCDENPCVPASTGSLVNTLSSTTGTALNVVNTTIGANKLEFRSVSANGGVNGIVVNNTGAGGVSVTGTGGAGSGGTVQNTTGRGASFITAQNIALTNMNFTNTATTDLDPDNSGLTTGDNLVTNAAIHLETVTGVTLTGISITGSAEQGINGHNVTAFALRNSSITSPGNGPDEDGVHFYNMLGTSEITNTTFTSSGDDNINIQNNTNVALPSGMTPVLTLTITGGSSNTGVLGSGYLMGIRGTSSATVTVDGVTANNNFSGGIVIDTFDTATSVIEIKNSTSTNNNDGISMSSNNGSTKFDIHDNVSFAGNDFGRINILKAAFSTAGTLQGKIRNNPIVVADGQTADGIGVFQAGDGTLTIAITNNNITYRGTQRAILVQGGQDGSGQLNATLTGNTIDMQLDGVGNAATGLLAQVAVASPSGDNTNMCADIGGAGALKNVYTHSLGNNMAAGDVRTRQRFVTTVTLPGYAGANNDNAAVVAYLAGRNTLVNAPTATATNEVGVTPGAGGYVGGGACPQPVFP